MSKNKQWDKGVRSFKQIRILTTEFDAEIKLIELGLAMRDRRLTDEEITKILNRQTSNSLNRIRDYINKRGGKISSQWVSQVNWIRNMVSHSVVWHDTFFYAPSNIEETREVLKICGIADVNENFKSPLIFRRENSNEFRELMRFFANTIKSATDEMKTQVVPMLAQDHKHRLNSLGSTITLTPMHWADYLTKMSE